MQQKLLVICRSQTWTLIGLKIISNKRELRKKEVDFERKLFLFSEHFQIVCHIRNMTFFWNWYLMICNLLEILKTSPTLAVQKACVLSQQMGCMRFSVSVHMVQVRQWHYISFSLLVVINKSHSYRVNNS